jgi:hypothetical protein
MQRVYDNEKQKTLSLEKLGRGFLYKKRKIFAKALDRAQHLWYIISSIQS